MIGIMNFIRSLLDGFTNWLLDFSAGYWTTAHPEVHPRIWSNRELAKYGGSLAGDVVNVSAGMDDDKEGRKYKAYFPFAKSYTITNYKRLHHSDSSMHELLLDLSVVQGVPESKYDVVFNHTVLEHVFEINTAIDNLCRMSRDIVITVVPFLQSMHMTEGVFKDYWRFTPFTLDRLFSVRGFETVYCNWNNGHPLSNVYIVHIASKCPDQHRNQFPILRLPETTDGGPGALLNNLLADTNSSSRRLARMAGKRVGRRFSRFSKLTIL